MELNFGIYLNHKEVKRVANLPKDIEDFIGTSTESEKLGQKHNRDVQLIEYIEGILWDWQEVIQTYGGNVEKHSTIQK